MPAIGEFCCNFYRNFGLNEFLYQTIGRNVYYYDCASGFL